MDLKKKVEDIFDVCGVPVIDVVSNMFLAGVTGSIAPGIASMVLAYKQKRSEKMIEDFMLEIKKRQAELGEKLLQLEVAVRNEITNKYFGLVMDYVIENKQEEKIKFIANGFINLASIENLREDVVLLYYDILDELTILDLRVLKIYLNDHSETYYDVVRDAGISDDESKLIKIKLERLDLIENRAQAQYIDLFENVKALSEYIEMTDKGKKPKQLRLKRTQNGSSKTRMLTPLGRKFLAFFSDKDS